MLNIVLFGPPGAGKGTQAQKLVDKYQLVHLSTGDVFRANLKAETELGLLARSYMDAGQLVPDNVTIQMLEAEVNKYPYAKGFIFDGFPRTQAQAEALDNLLQSKSSSISMMLALEVEEDELRKRLLLRGQGSGRPDDQNPDVIQKRIDVYNSETAPVKEFYSAQGKYFGVYGIGEIEDIFNALCDVIDSNSGEKSVFVAHVAEEKNQMKDDEPIAAKKAPSTKKKVVKKAKVSKPKSVAKKKVVKKASKKSPAKKKVVKKKVVAKKNNKKKVFAKKVVRAKAKKVSKKVVKKKTVAKKNNKKKVAAKSARPTARKVLKGKKVTAKTVRKPARPAGGKTVKVSKKKKK